MSILLSVNYILRYVYPGDYSGYLADSWEAGYCCNDMHITGKPFDQWNDEVIAGPKRDENRYKDLLADVKLNGFKNEIYIDLDNSHRVLANGHHRFYAAWDLGLTHIPVGFRTANFEKSIGRRYIKEDGVNRLLAAY
jgi:hypothetical protein